jgi:hypothetical protein
VALLWIRLRHIGSTVLAIVFDGGWIVLAAIVLLDLAAK